MIFGSEVLDIEKILVEQPHVGSWEAIDKQHLHCLVQKVVVVALPPVEPRNHRLRKRRLKQANNVSRRQYLRRNRIASTVNQCLTMPTLSPPKQ